MNTELRPRGLWQLVHNWGLPLMVGVLLASLWALILVATTTQRQRLVDESRRELTQLNNAVAQQVTALFRKAESDLRVIDRWIQAHPKVDPRTDPQFAALLDELRIASQGLIDLRLVSVDGHSIAIPATPASTGLSVRNQPGYQAMLSSSERMLVIGEPVLSRSTKRWRIPLLWRLQAPAHGVHAAFAGIELNRLDALHEQMRLKPNGSVMLMRADGAMLSRTPFDQSHFGRNLSKGANFHTEYGSRLRGFFFSPGQSDGVARLVSYQRLDDYPVTVMVNRPLEDVLSVYLARRDVLFAVATALTLLALGFTWVLFRSQHALRRAQHNLQLLEATDSLTGVMSRRAFLDAAQREYSRARRYSRPTAVLLFDLDHFKNVNDSHGHAVGDIVLRSCAAAWKAVLREQDLLGRIGGEEFCAVLPETPPASALQAAERLRRAVVGLKFQGKGGEFEVRVSVGVAMLSKSDEELAQTMERADRALYLAKDRGRDRVEFLDEPRLAVVGAAGSGQDAA